MMMTEVFCRAKETNERDQNYHVDILNSNQIIKIKIFEVNTEKVFFLLFPAMQNTKQPALVIKIFFSYMAKQRFGAGVELGANRS